MKRTKNICVDSDNTLIVDCWFGDIDNTIRLNDLQSASIKKLGVNQSNLNNVQTANKSSIKHIAATAKLANKLQRIDKPRQLHQPV